MIRPEMNDGMSTVHSRFGDSRSEQVGPEELHSSVSDVVLDIREHAARQIVDDSNTGSFRDKRVNKV
jgi:hypothetical protein